LLAEAFWLMESYFVRTLGMHRVYNSAFMVLLRDEENAKYRSLMKNTLEFDPEILKRYVNFMNNPDERTAVDQFGKGDKYFGVCTLMATLPGLPMFGHGQVEGFTEKYGMEYQRAYWEEAPDEWLIARHEREIFPLLHRRYLFAEVNDFLLYDFFMADGNVNEDVFAYSNRFGDERVLVVYHNRYADISGWIRLSAAYSVKTGQGDERVLKQKNMGEGLALRAESDYFCIFRDQITGLEYIRNSKELFEQGMYVELGAYKCHVFLDIREVQDNAWHQHGELAAYLGGRGVPSIDEALKELFLQPILQPFKQLVNGETFRRLYDARITKPEQVLDAALLDEIEHRTVVLLKGIKTFAEAEGDEVAVAQDIRRTVEAVLQLPVLRQRFGGDGADAASALPPEADDTQAKPTIAGKDRSEISTSSQPQPESDGDAAVEPAADPFDTAVAKIQGGLADELPIWSRVFGWAFVHALGKLADAADYDEQSRSWIDEWLLGRMIARALQEVGLDETAAARAVVIIKRLTSYQHWYVGEATTSTHETLEALLRDSEMQQLLGINRYQGVLWFNQQSFERLLWWLLLLASVLTSADPARAPGEVAETIAACHNTVHRLRIAAKESSYQVEKLLELSQAPIA
ncbi:MAG TPA: alpha-amylase, partial [Roseiflexaceae bacterium]|nr:alpha-amylase [Roseiflexaceae bacterium]